MQTYTPDAPSFKKSTQITDTNTLAHADNINHAPKDAFDNTIALKIMALGAVEEYDESSAYNAGDYSINSGKLFKCNTTIASGGEAWTADHWDETDVLKELKAVVDELGLGGGSSGGSGVSLSGGKVTVSDDSGNSMEVKPDGTMVFTDDDGATTVSLKDIKAVIDWVNNTGKGIPATVTAAASAASAAQSTANTAKTNASTAQSTANTAKSTADSVNTWKNKYNTLIQKLAGEA